MQLKCNGKATSPCSPHRTQCLCRPRLALMGLPTLSLPAHTLARSHGPGWSAAGEFLWNTPALAARMASSQGGMLMAGLGISLSRDQPWSPEPLPTPRDPPLSPCFPSSCSEHHPEKAGPGLGCWIAAPISMRDRIHPQFVGSDPAATANKN